MKFQFSIYVGKAEHKNSASTKAVNDCSTIFTALGYQSYNLFVAEYTNVILRYVKIFKELLRFYSALPKGALVGIQYPLLNNFFKFFIKVARLKKVIFFCIIHDIESLRLGGQDEKLVKHEIKNLNFYDCLIVHNEEMLQWLTNKGITSKMVSLGIFDYLLTKVSDRNNNIIFSNSIVFAGNLEKSNFLYSLNEINNWNFNIYGPNYRKEKNKSSNVIWKGEYSPEEIVYQLEGNFGLIWDGDRIDKCDKVLGNYLKYNNPHKLSLYLAAGLPVIAPKDSAIGKMITDLKIGILINDLRELKNLQISKEDYKALQNNCSKIKNQIVKGEFFMKAIEIAEKQLMVDNKKSEL